jgi:hypothetical protein
MLNQPKDSKLQYQVEIQYSRLSVKESWLILCVQATWSAWASLTLFTSLGQRALAERGATIGQVYMLSFSNMAEVLGWEPI